MNRKDGNGRFFTRTLCLLLIVSSLVGSLPTRSSSRAQEPPPDLPGVSEVAGPGWHLASAGWVEPDEAQQVLSSQQAPVEGQDVQNLAAGLPTSETEATPEILALAQALQNDPKLIFDYVHNYIDYVPTYGSANGATATLYARRGNDWDQASLFIALMRAAGYTANYVVGDVVYSVSRLANWTGVENDINVVGNVFANGGVPVEGVPDGLKITRVWAQAVIGGQTYVFDPAMKEYQDVTGIDLAAATGYDQATFLSRAQSGATVTGDYAQNMNEANIRADLATYSTNLVNYIEDNVPNASVAEVIGGHEIIPTEMSTYPTSLPYALSVSNETTYTTLPDTYRHTLRVQHEGIDYTFKTFEIATRRVSIFYRDGDYVPILRVDGTPVVTGSVTISGTTYPMTITVDHPYAAAGGTFADQQGSFDLTSGSSYVVIHDLGSVSSPLISQRNRLLTQYLQDGLAEASESVRGEALWIMGLTWCHEVSLFSDLVGRLGNVVSLRHHTVGVMGQEEGYFIDMPMVMVSIAPGDGTSDTWPVFRAQTMMASAFEHGVLEQQQGSDKPAASTVKLLQISNSTAVAKTFLANSGNWSTVEPQLQNYSASTKAAIAAGISAGHEYVLPEDANITLNQWRGVGYIDHYQSGDQGSTSMIISGGYLGGYNSTKDDLSIEQVLKEIKEAYLSPFMREEIDSPASRDPVDMTSGAFLYDHLDLAVGPAGPLELGFVRSYNSGHREASPLGYGWSHNHNIFLRFHSDGGPPLGQRQPTDAASLIVSAYVTLDLLETPLNIQKWTTAVLTNKWAMDQLIDNGITVYMGLTTLEYIKLADGTYNPPPGIRDNLVQAGSSYYLCGPVNACLTFDAEGKVRAWQDTNGNTVIYTYDGGGKLQTIANSLGLTLTLTYSGSLITSVSDQAGRSVSFGYTDADLATYQDAEGHTWRYAYDTAHRMVSVTHPLSNVVVTNVYDAFGRVVTQTDALGNVSRFFFSDFRNMEENPDGSRQVHYFDAQARATGREDTLGNRVQMSYDGQYHLRTLTDRMGDTTSFTYDPASGWLATVTNNEGNTITYTYAAQVQTFTNPISPTETVTCTFYNLIRVDYPDGTNEQFAYDTQGNLTTYTDQAGQVWSYQYNARGQVTRVTNPTGGTMDYTYNSDGTLATSTDSDVGITTYGYDAYKRLNRITHPDSTFVQIAYDLNDRVTAITDERSKTYSFEYDDNGSLIRATDPSGEEMQYAYDLMDRMTGRTDRRGKTTQFAYDEMGRLSSVTDPNGNSYQLDYNSRGWLTQITDPAGKIWQLVYDDEGVLTSATTPGNRTATFDRDQLGNLTGITDPLGNAETFTRDEMNRVTAATDPLNRTTAYTYDESGLLTAVTLPDSSAATYDYNNLGLLSTIHDLRGKEWSFDYTSMGRLQRLTDPLGNRWQYAYNQRGFLEQVTYPTGETRTPTYDAAGNLIRQQYSGGLDLHFTYDDLNRLISADGITLTYNEVGQVVNTQNPPVSFGATYDDGGRLETVSYADGLFTVTYQYDSRDLLTQVSDSLTGATVQFTYDDDGRLTGVTRSNGVNATLTWDDASRLTRIQEGALADMQYTYNAAGEVTQAVLDLPLDPADYLVEQVINLSYDDASQVSSSGYAYDARGRLTSSPGYTFTWDGASRLVGVDSVTFTYNGLGDLVTRSEGGSTTHYYYNYALGLTPIVAESVGGSYKRFYVYTPGGSLLYSIDPATGQVRFYHFDRVGSTLFLTDGGGNVTDAYAYDPYGTLLAHTGPSDQPFTFVGKWGVRQEGADGTLYHMRARYYDAATGHFVSRDPIWPTSLDSRESNPYQYALSDPLSKVDPNGLRGGFAGEIAGWGLEAAAGVEIPNVPASVGGALFTFLEGTPTGYSEGDPEWGYGGNPCVPGTLSYRCGGVTFITKEDYEVWKRREEQRRAREAEAAWWENYYREREERLEDRKWWARWNKIRRQARWDAINFGGNRRAMEKVKGVWVLRHNVWYFFRGAETESMISGWQILYDGEVVGWFPDEEVEGIKIFDPERPLPQWEFGGRQYR
ncbi:MAG: hypothetical protein H5T62_00955 [Anaerolineae bacterium]|nr:hypothetical protein [Anaerolineae bacterium]